MCRKKETIGFNNFRTVLSELWAGYPGNILLDHTFSPVLLTREALVAIGSGRAGASGSENVKVVAESFKLMMILVEKAKCFSDPNHHQRATRNVQYM